MQALTATCVVSRWTVNFLSTLVMWRVVPQVLKVSTCNVLLSKIISPLVNQIIKGIIHSKIKLYL